MSVLRVRCGHCHTCLMEPLSLGLHKCTLLHIAGTALRQHSMCSTTPVLHHHGGALTHREEGEGEAVAAQAAATCLLPSLHQLAANLAARRLHARPAQGGHMAERSTSGADGSASGQGRLQARLAADLACRHWACTNHPCPGCAPAPFHTTHHRNSCCRQHDAEVPIARLTCRAGRPWRP